MERIINKVEEKKGRYYCSLCYYKEKIILNWDRSVGDKGEILFGKNRLSIDDPLRNWRSVLFWGRIFKIEADPKESIRREFF